MDRKKVFNGVLFLLFLAFVIGYVIEETGYYEYNLQNKTVMTNESMAKFEEDLKEGKDVTIEDYVVDTNKDYTSYLTRGTNKISVEVNKYLKKGIEGVFKILGNFVE